MHSHPVPRARSRAAWRAVMVAIAVSTAGAACTPADQADPADSAVVDDDSPDRADSLSSPGWREMTGSDPADPFETDPEVVSRYLDEVLRYRSVGSYWVQIPGTTPDSARVRFEVVRGSHLIGEDEFAEDGHVIHRYVLESANREVPSLGLSSRDSVGYLYVLPGRSRGEPLRYGGRFAIRTPEGGWRPASDTRLVVVPGVSRPAGVPDGAWLVWGVHEDEESMQARDSVGRTLFGREGGGAGPTDHCFACWLDWCLVTPERVGSAGASGA